MASARDFISGADMSAQRDARDDADTCRICRGEGSGAEPLFHPCKCSGSIMHVHQDCLMEWLAHSQKKHCELCKTPFRFTKLYHPQMPSILPTSVFLQRATSHILATLLVWIRATLVALTWLLWLPWTMRFVWWGLFWLADIAWTLDPGRNGRAFPNDSTSDIEMTRLSVSQSKPTASSTADPGGPLMLQLAQLAWKLVYGPGIGAASVTQTTQNDTLTSATIPARGTLLSNLAFFRDLTSSPSLNKAITDVLEGQLITLTLVAAIILVLLIREWVVQQQPIIHLQQANDEAGIDHPEHEQAGQMQDGDPQPERDAPGPHAELDGDDEMNTSEADLAVGDDSINSEGRRDSRQFESFQFSAQDLSERSEFQDTAEQSGPSQQRPSMPSRADSFMATGIRRRLEENLIDDPIQEYLRETSNQTLMPNSTEHLTADESSLQRQIPNSTSPQTVNSGEDSDTSWQQVDPDLNEPGSSLHATEIAVRDHTSHTNAISHSADRRRHQAMETNIDSKALQEARPNNHNLYEEISTQRPEYRKQRPAPRRWLSNASRHSISEESPTNVQDTDDLDGHVARAISEEDAEVPEQYEDSHMTSDSASERRLVLSDSSPSTSGSMSPSNESQSQQNDPSSPPGPSTRQQEDPLQTETEIQAEPRGLIARSLDWLWGDIGPAEQNQVPAENEERIVVDAAAEDPFVPVVVGNAHGPIRRIEVDRGQEPDRLANQNDAEAMDDAEDLEGVLELIGMQGPVMGLFTNAMFASVFVSCTIALAVWIPFMTGKVALLALAHPLEILRLPLQILSNLVSISLDIVVLCIASAVQWLLVSPTAWLINTCQDVFMTWHDNHFLIAAEAFAGQLLNDSSTRLTRSLSGALDVTKYADSHLTLDSHVALRQIQWSLSLLWSSLREQTTSLFSSVSETDMSLVGLSRQSLVVLGVMAERTRFMAATSVEMLKGTSASLWSDGLTITYKTSPDLQTTAEQLSEWTAFDRGLVVALGYGAIATCGALYLMYAAPLAQDRQSRKVENVILEILNQAGGITKVVLIISIEMLAFPLYCGMLLDFAMLPLFAHASFSSRILFTLNSPWTSLFLHWFIGTCYMFHFALFVAMCRKILRNGTLYFIRDPDDPTFHPVRDVLERSVVFQLRKIASSALIYGGLVILCLGSVLWLLAYAVPGLLPVRWTSNNGTSAFPLDLLLYTTLKPIIIRYFTLQDEFYQVYEWWLRRCARMLRLSDFLFGDGPRDEQRRADNDEQNDAAPLASGQWARVPANDQVRVPKGTSAFREVDGNGYLKDGSETSVEPGKGPTDPDFTRVYLPPWFRARIGLFVASIWAMTAGLGFSLTVVPLRIGRSILHFMLPKQYPTNDMYNLAIGLTMFLIIAYSWRKGKRLLAQARRLYLQSLNTSWPSPSLILRLSAPYRTRLASVVYTYTTLAILMPALMAVLAELYIMNPLHAHMSDGSLPYKIHFIRSWTLGTQYVRILIRILQWRPESRPARALDAVFERGYLNPNISVATRYFFLPATVVAFSAIFLPVPVGWMAGQAFFESDDNEGQAYARIFAYPAVLGLCLIMWAVHGLLRATARWRLRIRDEVYLIGERLHNFGEQKPPVFPGHTNGYVPQS